MLTMAHALPIVLLILFAAFLHASWNACCAPAAIASGP
jgi:hypothetical protein